MKTFNIAAANRKHNRVTDDLEKTIAIARQMSAGRHPAGELDALIETHFDHINPKSPRDIQEGAQELWAENTMLYARASIDFLKLEYERPAIQKLRLIFGLYADGQYMDQMPNNMIEMRPTHVLTFTQQFEEAFTNLEATRPFEPEETDFFYQDLMDAMTGIHACNHNSATDKAKTPDTALRYIIDYAARAAQAHMDMAESIQRMNESTLVAVWMEYKARKAQRGIVPFNERGWKQRLRAEGKAARADLTDAVDSLTNHRNMVEYVKTLMEKLDAHPPQGATSPYMGMRMIS